MEKQLTQRQLTSAKIREYVLSCIDGEGYGKVLNTEQEKVKFLIDTFVGEYCYPENLRYYGTKQKTFENWLMGLPSSFNIDYENYRIIEIGKEWGFLAADANDKKEDKWLGQWWSRIYMEVSKLANKHKIEF